MVPPALGEVGQLVLQAVFQELKHDTDDHTHPPVADHQSLEGAKENGNKVKSAMEQKE